MKTTTVFGVISMAFSFGLLLSPAHASIFSSFSDQDDFAEWYADSAYKMEFNEIMTGYPDGEFKGTEPVNRAELAVILDRYTQKVLDKKLSSSSQECPVERAYGLKLQVTDQLGTPLTDVWVQAQLPTAIGGEATILGYPSSWDFEHIGSGNYTGLWSDQDVGSHVIVLKKDGYITHYVDVYLPEEECYEFGMTKSVVLIKQSE